MVQAILQLVVIIISELSLKKIAMNTLPKIKFLESKMWLQWKYYEQSPKVPEVAYNAKAERGLRGLWVCSDREGNHSHTLGSERHRHKRHMAEDQSLVALPANILPVQP